jgi:hypothetical protein
MRKVSFSISDRLLGAMFQAVGKHSAKASTVVEAALREFLKLEDTAQQRAIHRALARKRSLSLSSWKLTFWRLMNDEFDLPAPGATDNSNAPRVYQGFTVVFLLSDDPIYVHAFDDPTQRLQGQRSEMTMTYALDDDVWEAAEVTASWIRAEKQKLDRQRRLLDDAN